jgi:cytochrome c556
MEGPEEKGDTKALAAAYEKLAAMAPDPKWNEGESGWAAISKAGAEAAKKGDMVAAKAQCKSCHKAWRGKYKDSFRSKPLPK